MVGGEGGLRGEGEGRAGWGRWAVLRGEVSLGVGSR